MMSASKKKIIVTILIIVIALLILCFAFPQPIFILSGTRYLKQKYPDKGFSYDSIEYSKYHAAYLVYYIDKSGKKIALLMSGPWSVLYDPLNPPG